jgi:hypothetical protein
MGVSADPEEVAKKRRSKSHVIGEHWRPSERPEQRSNPYQARWPAKGAGARFMSPVELFFFFRSRSIFHPIISSFCGECTRASDRVF